MLQKIVDTFASNIRRLVGAAVEDAVRNGINDGLQAVGKELSLSYTPQPVAQPFELAPLTIESTATVVKSVPVKQLPASQSKKVRK